MKTKTDEFQAYPGNAVASPIFLLLISPTTLIFISKRDSSLVRYILYKSLQSKKFTDLNVLCHGLNVVCNLKETKDRSFLLDVCKIIKLLMMKQTLINLA